MRQKNRKIPNDELLKIQESMKPVKNQIAFEVSINVPIEAIAQMSDEKQQAFYDGLRKITSVKV